MSARDVGRNVRYATCQKQREGEDNVKKAPISLIIEDSAPIISVYHEHANIRTTNDGRELLPTFPNRMLLSFFGHPLFFILLSIKQLEGSAKKYFFA